MRYPKISDDEKPSFCWDRSWTVGEIKRRLREADERERDRLMAWILREATFCEVWQFFSPREVADRLSSIQSQLGRWKDFWPYIIGKWRELGKI